LGDGVAEWTKASVATRTETGSILGMGGIFLRAVTVTEERPPTPTRAWQIPTGAHQKILPNTKNVFLQPFPTEPKKPYSTILQLMTSVSGFKTNEKKKINKCYISKLLKYIWFLQFKLFRYFKWLKKKFILTQLFLQSNIIVFSCITIVGESLLEKNVIIF